MPEYDVRGVRVSFPHEAYECQLVYMERVVEALEEGKHALLESPTGTGKTLCLLCATLAWRQQYLQRNPEKDAPKIIYSSRTHAQLQQVIQELKNTPYRPRMSILGSRNQMCINQEAHQADRGGQLNMICSMLRNSKRCVYGSRAKEVAGQLSRTISEPFDIEDIVKLGKEHRGCPYYMTRGLHETCEIAFMPYNYLLDARNRKGIVLDENTILIMDEAHNVETVCCDASSFDLTANDLRRAIGDTDRCIRMFAYDFSGTGKESKNKFSLLKAQLVGLERALANIQTGENGFTRDGVYIQEFLAAPGIGINHSNVTNAVQTIEEAEKLLTGMSEDAKKPPESDAEDDGLENRVASSNENSAVWLTAVKDCLEIAFRVESQSASQVQKAKSIPYKFHIHMQHDQVTKKKLPTLSYWCFDPGLAMRELCRKNIRSILLTSGTLAPLDTLASELSLDFPVRLENPHVIKQSQILAGVMPVGPSNGKLNSSFRHRNSDSYKMELGNAIVNIARVVPHGLLVFFPSYSVLSSCIESWKVRQSGVASVWERIAKLKYPVVEPKNSADYAQAALAFRTWIEGNRAKGAVFFAVCRGKVSEGIDFSDRAGRAVVVTGVPYAMRFDPKVSLKREYLDQKCALPKAKGLNGTGNFLSGEAWYTQEAFRAVNQAVGRVIRHRSDYGAIIYADERFSNPSYRERMSMWLRPHLQVFSTFGSAAASLSQFFRQQENQAYINAVPAKRLASASVIQDNFEGRAKYVDDKNGIPDQEMGCAENGKGLPNRSIGAAKIAGLVGLAKGAASHQTMSENTANAQAQVPGGNSLVNMLQRTQKDHPQKHLNASSFRLSEQLRPATAQASHTLANGMKIKQQLSHIQEAEKGPHPMVSTAQISPDTKTFLQRAKASLSADGLLKFKELLVTFKKDGKTVDSFTAFLENLMHLLQRENAMELLEGLATFIPPDFREYFEHFRKGQGFEHSRKYPEVSGAEPKLPQYFEKKKQICIVCNSNVENAHAAVCGHIACYSCWKSLLQRPEQRKCPTCGIHVDRAKLMKKFFV